MKKLLTICGPTATGKTQIARRLAGIYKGELLSVDSRQIYVGLDILTGKDIPSGSERFLSEIDNLPVYIIDGIKTWMYDVVGWNEKFSVGQYQYAAQRVIENIQSRGFLPIAVGGTGLYFQSITHVLSAIHIPPNKELREKLSQASVENLQKELGMVDMHRLNNMNKSDRYNPRRLVRAIEVAMAGHESVKKSQNDEDILEVGLYADISFLERKIADRVKGRWQGAVEEVKEVLEEKTSLEVLGFSAVAGYLQGKWSQEEACRHWIQQERLYAKRQYVFFKKNPAICWFDISIPGYEKEVIKFVHTWYTKINDIKN